MDASSAEGFPPGGLRGLVSTLGATVRSRKPDDEIPSTTECGSQHHLGRRVRFASALLLAAGGLAWPPCQAQSTVFSDVNHALLSPSVNLTLTAGSSARAGMGNVHDNVINANGSSAGLLGLRGDDELNGGSGDDSIGGGLGDDTLRGGLGADRLIGDGGNDTLIGGAGDDRLLGGFATNFASVMRVTTLGVEVATWIAAPGLSYMEAYVRFAPDLPEDQIFGIDQEYVEGIVDPLRYSGADWMGILAVDRNGMLHVTVGTDEEIAGSPATQSLSEAFDLGVTLQPDVWYRLSSVVDFGKLEFVSFTLTGPGVDVTIDLGGRNVSYTEHLPTDVPGITSFLWTARTPSGSTSLSEGLALVFFDDFRRGIEVDGQVVWIQADSFESADPALVQPDRDSTLLLSTYDPNRWYYERLGAISWSSTTGPARTGVGSMALLAVGDPEPLFSTDNDLLDGGAGNDKLFGDEGDDELRGGPGEDRLHGGPGEDTIYGDDDNDVLIGGLGADTMLGGPGNDFYSVEDVFDVVIEVSGEGFDEVFAFVDYELPPEVEKLILGLEGGPFDGTGNVLDNEIVGSEDHNVLEGRAGDDSIRGRGGNDTLRGESGSDVLLGGQGDDALHGGPGLDTLRGGPGDDLFIVDDDDVVEETAFGGNDAVSSKISYSLPPFVEFLFLAEGAGSIDGTGNGLDNYIIGNSEPNSLLGGDGDDILLGGAGPDFLVGGDGADVLISGAGADLVTGNVDFDLVVDGASDRFVYLGPDMGDVIVGFDTSAPSAGGDVVELAAASSLPSSSIAVDCFSSPSGCWVTLLQESRAPFIRVMVLGVHDANALSDNVAP